MTDIFIDLDSAPRADGRSASDALAAIRAQGAQVHAAVSSPNGRDAVSELFGDRVIIGPDLKALPGGAVFVSADASRVDAARARGMRAIQFASWDELPLLVARALGNDSAAEEAVSSLLTSRYGVRVSSMTSSGAGAWKARGTALVKLDEANLGAMRGVHVELPVDLSITTDDDGNIRGVEGATPPPEAVDEAAAFVADLGADGGSTHQIVVDDQGRRILRRKAFFGAA